MMTSNNPPPATAKFLEQERFLNAAASSGLQRKAFLAGPYIEIEKRPRKSKKNVASMLRFELYQRLSNEGWVVTLGEYKELIGASQSTFGRHNNSAAAEIAHARQKNLDAIVMLPSSPGSFLELGAFAHIGEICRKMIVIIDRKYESHINYMNSGPVRVAKSLGADVVFENYEDHESVWGIVAPFVEDRVHLKALESIIAP